MIWYREGDKPSAETMMTVIDNFIIFCPFRLTPLNNVGPALRDNMVVSAEDKPYICVAMGTITSISSDAVQVILDR